jgi:hypothetical protein
LIATVSVSPSGIELGHRTGRRIEYDARLLAGRVLAAVGIVIAARFI